MTDKKPTKKEKTEKEKITEVFDIEKNTEVIKEHTSKKQIANQKRQLKMILFIMAGLILFVIFILVWMKMIRTIYYEDVKFEIVQEGDLILYNTKVPLYNSGGEHYGDYNYYLRINPKDLKKVPFEGELELKNGYTINLTKDFGCGGYGQIGFANLMKEYELEGRILINDKNAACDELSRYVYYEIKEGNETKIVQRGNMSCYDVYVNNCEILQATEKLLVETIAKNMK